MGFILDIRYALRLLAKSPKFTLLTSFILMAGLTVSLLTFNFVYTISFKPLDGEQASSIRTPHLSGATDNRSLTFEDVDNIGEYQLNSIYSEYVLHFREEVRLNSEGKTANLLGEKVTVNFFDFTGGTPILGRNFNNSDGQRGATPVVAISHHVWQNIFAGQPDIIGKNLLLGGASYEVIAVMPEGFKFPVTSDLWLPFEREQLKAFDQKGKIISILAKINPQISGSQANDRLAQQLQQVRLKRLTETEKVDFVSPTITHMTLQQQNIEGMGAFIFIGLQGFALAILFMACINTGNLLFSRSIERQKETAIRGALGATTKRLVRQLVCEGGILTLLGGLMAIVVTGWILNLVNSNLQISLGSGMPFWWQWQLDWQTLAVAVLFMVFTFIFACLIPSIRAANMDINTVLRDGTRGSLGRGAGKLSNIIVTVQVAIIAILMLSGSLGSSVIFTVIDVVKAERTENRFSAYFDLSHPDYTSAHSKVTFVESSIQSLSRLSSINQAAMLQGLGLNPVRMDKDTRLRVDVMTTMGNLDFFEQKIVSGRGIDARDNSENMRVALVSESFVQRHWENVSPLGKQIDVDLDGKFVTHTVVGVVSDRNGNTQGMYAPISQYDEIYVSYLQSPHDWVQLIFEGSNTVNSSQKDFYTWLERAQANELFSFIVDLEKNANLYADMLSMMSDGVIYSGVFSLFLALMGVYGVSAASVVMRSHEIGIRRALGAKDKSIIILFLKRNMGPLVIGLGIGLLIYALSSFIFASMIGSKITIMTYIIIAVTTSVLLTFMLMLSGYLPTRRAVVEEPIAALRAE